MTSPSEDICGACHASGRCPVCTGRGASDGSPPNGRFHEVILLSDDDPMFDYVVEAPPAPPENPSAGAVFIRSPFATIEQYQMELARRIDEKALLGYEVIQMQRQGRSVLVLMRWRWFDQTMAKKFEEKKEAAE